MKKIIPYLLSMLALAGCATTQSGAMAKTNAQAVQKAPVHYVCKGCGAKIPRTGATSSNFIEKCPRCGKQFLSM